MKADTIVDEATHAVNNAGYFVFQVCCNEMQRVTIFRKMLTIGRRSNNHQLPAG